MSQRATKANSKVADDTPCSPAVFNISTTFSDFHAGLAGATKQSFTLTEKVLPGI
jgi:hypothetical protein